MVKLIATPSRLHRLFNSALPLRKQKECPIRFTPLDAQINFVSDDIIILAKFYRSYFIDFESCDEWFILHRRLIGEFKRPHTFKKGENLLFSTDSEYAHIKGGCKDFTSPLKPIEERMTVSPFQPTMTEYGLMPVYEGRKKVRYTVQARLTAEQLVTNLQLNKKDDTGLRWNGKTLELFCRNGFRCFSHTLDPLLFLQKGKPITIYLNWSNFQDLAKQFVGEIWLGIAKNAVAISQAEHDFCVTYLLKAERVDDEFEY